MRAGLLLTVAGLLVGGPERPSDSSIARTTECLVDEWILARVESSGTVAPMRRGSAVFTKDVVILGIGGPPEPFAYWLDVTRSPKAIDFTTKTQHCLGIYSLDGDHLTICIRQPPGVRPRELKSDDHTVLLVFQRKKPKKR